MFRLTFHDVGQSRGNLMQRLCPFVRYLCHDLFLLHVIAARPVQSVDPPGPLQLNPNLTFRIRLTRAIDRRARFRDAHRYIHLNMPKNCGGRRYTAIVHNAQLQRVAAGIILLKDLSHELGRTMSRLSAQMSFSTRLQPTAVFFAGVALWLNTAIAQAGPCTADISQFEATVHQSAGDPLAGLTARQSVNAQLGHQPTPQSVHQADQRLKSRFSAAMARAKRYDEQGNLPGCARALDAAKKIYIP
jgi:hypothetical protein